MTSCLILHKNVEVLAWKPRRVEALASRNESLISHSSPQDGDSDLR